MSGTATVTIPALQRMKREGRKIVGVVAWDVQIARIADRAGVEIVSVGDSVGVNMWGHASEREVTMDEMVIVCKAVRRGVTRALVSCDLPYGPLQTGTRAAVDAALRLVEQGGADIVKVDGAAQFPEAVRAMARAGITVFAQMELADGADVVADALGLEDAGVPLIDFKHSGPIAGAAVVSAVGIPVIGGLGGGPWLDGRLRMAHAAIGYAASNLDTPAEAYANVAKIAFDALAAMVDDVRQGRPIKGS